MIDINDHPKIIQKINEALNYGTIVELKVEKKGVSVVEITRRVRAIEPAEPEK